LKDFLDTLKSDKKYEKYFKSDIRFFEERLRVWMKGQIRIGLIGVTSSGKSTLINALLGQKLLPQKVRPSSSVIVICGFGEKDSATVLFDRSSGKSPASYEDNIKKTLEQYGDEGENQHNSKQVSEIHLRSPAYKLPHDVSLVDSPGLDAFGMDGHEKITLQLALPTLDMVLFLTTVKANSDRENLQRIDQVTEDDKPLIVLQNMIDSVEPKIAKGGKVEKDCATVRGEHKYRIEKLLKNAKKESTRAAQVIQVSAIRGLEGPWENSNLDNLIDSIISNKKWLNERSILARATQIKNRLVEMISGLKKMDSDDQYLLDELNKLSEYTGRVTSLKGGINAKFDYFQQHIKALSDKLEKFNKTYTDINSAKVAGKELFAKPKLLNKELSKFISEVQKNEKKIAKDLNLRSEDMNFHIQSFSESLNFSVPTKEEQRTHTRQVKRRTAGGAIARGFGWVFRQDDWGYDTITEHETYIIVDKAKFVEVVKSKINKWISWFSESSNTFGEATEEKIQLLREEIENKVESLNQKKEMTISDSERVSMLSKLAEHQKKLGQYSVNTSFQSEKGSQAIPDDKYFDFELPKVIFDIFTIGQRESYQIFSAFKDYCIEMMKNPERLMAVGWDDSDIDKFTELFFSDYHSGETNASEGNVSDIDAPAILSVINADSENIQDSISGKNSTKQLGVFVIVDIQQIGMAEKKIRDLTLQKINQVGVTWVVQSIEALINSNALMEGFIEFFKLLNRLELPVQGLLISNRDPLYTLLINELYNNGNQILNARDSVSVERQWLKRFDNILNLSQKKRETLVQYLRIYKLLNEKGAS